VSNVKRLEPNRAFLRQHISSHAADAMLNVLRPVGPSSHGLETRRWSFAPR
jgi:hypothetical protein